ncbi:MAG: GNAT family N-acetyltransferase [Gemmataceae bacterium]|nr:GNAT family N-acetyltransferase [Gemmataceae bacterium]
MITVRPFRNPDPPRLVELWTASVAGPRSIPVRGCTLLEYFTFAKPYFDPAGLLLAFDGEKPVGFLHAGFAPDVARGRLDQTRGIVSAVAVLPSYRRQGVATRLLAQAEDYLRAKGAREAVAGGMTPDNPFLFGLYGGADSPGFLAGDEGARPFLEKLGYALARTRCVFQRQLTRLQMPADPRFAAFRPRYEIIAALASKPGWWRECVLGPVEAVEYVLRDKASGEAHARVLLWDMDTFGTHWGQPCAGVLEIETRPAHRRKGLAKYLLANVMRHLRERSFHLMEAQAAPDDAPALALLRLLEFQQVEAGHSYRKAL